MAIASKILDKMRSRGKDPKGDGRFGASRKRDDGSTYKHQGLDIRSSPNEPVFSPIAGTIVRDKNPYWPFKGILIEGIGEWAGYEVTMFYVKRSADKGAFISQGEIIGHAQNLTSKYPGITNHVHIEVRVNGCLVNPEDLWQMCF